MQWLQDHLKKMIYTEIVDDIKKQEMCQKGCKIILGILGIIISKYIFYLPR